MRYSYDPVPKSQKYDPGAKKINNLESPKYDREPKIVVQEFIMKEIIGKEEKTIKHAKHEYRNRANYIDPKRISSKRELPGRTAKKIIKIGWKNLNPANTLIHTITFIRNREKNFPS